MKRFAGISVAVLILLMPAGCKKKAETADEPIQAAESVAEGNFVAETEPAAGAAAGNEMQSEAPSTAPAAPEAAPAPLPPSTASGTPQKNPAVTASPTGNRKSSGDRIDDMFIYKMNQKRVVPEDYLIGPLENLQNSDYRVTQILKTLNTFFRDLRIGTLNEDCIHPSAVLLLSSAFQFYLEEEAVPDVVRIGKVEITGKSARVNLRFYRGNGVTDGETILEETTVDKSKQWLITDCQADLMQLLDPYKPSGEPFQPGAYNFYNWE